MDLYIKCETPDIYKIYEHYNNIEHNKCWFPLVCVNEQAINPNQGTNLSLGVKCSLKKIRNNIKSTNDNPVNLFTETSFWVLTNEVLSKTSLICRECPFPVDKSSTEHITLSVLNLGSSRTIIKKGYQFFRITTPTLENIRKIYVS